MLSSISVSREAARQPFQLWHDLPMSQIANIYSLHEKADPGFSQTSSRKYNAPGILGQVFFLNAVGGTPSDFSELRAFLYLKLVGRLNQSSHRCLL